MNCDAVRDLIALGAGGEITDHERIAVEGHVAVCAECARDLADYRGLVGNLALLREGDAPVGTAERIWEGVRFAVPSRGPRALPLAWAARAAAILVVGLSLGFTAMSVTRGQTPASDLSMDSRPEDASASTYVPSIRGPAHKTSGGETGAFAPETPKGVDMMAVPPAPAPTEGVIFHLPRADAILSQILVRF
jgi:anti-sigma factor RsiW